jgi:hypothetical protein
MPMRVEEAKREIPVRDEVEVLVAGGGLGGVAATLAAARTGARTLLLERNGFLGGTATAGMCCSVFNCFFMRGGEQGTVGIPEEIVDALAVGEGYGGKWRAHKGHIIYDTERGKLVLAELVNQAGAEVFYQAVVAGTLVEGGALKGVVVESKSGREAILAKTVIDATGDADVAARAGVPLHIQERGVHSLCFRLGKVDVDAFVDFFRRNPEQYPERMDVDWSMTEALAQFDDCGTFLFPHGGGVQLEAFQRARADGALPGQVGIHDSVDACQMHAIRQTGIVHVITGFSRFNGLDIEKISRSMGDGRRMAFEMARVFRDYVPGFEEAFVVGTGTNLGVRTSRYLDGDFVFTAEMMEGGRRQEDAVGRGVGWDNRVVHPGKGAWGCQICREDSFDLPYRCLVPPKVEGLLMGAGRSISAENPSLLRVMVHTMMVGQAAGVASGMAVRRGEKVGEVAIGSVQKELARQGVNLR